MDIEYREGEVNPAGYVNVTIVAEGASDVDEFWRLVLKHYAERKSLYIRHMAEHRKENDFETDTTRHWCLARIAVSAAHRLAEEQEIIHPKKFEDPLVGFHS